MTDFDNLDFQTEKLKRLILIFSEFERGEVLAALHLSAHKHVNQKRKSGEVYVVHPIRVANLLLEELGVSDKDVVCAALLHDTIEDTDLTLEEINERFGKRVTHLVLSLSKRRGESNETYIPRVLAADQDTVVIKLSDRLDNCRDLVASAKTSPQFVQRQILEVESYYLPYTKVLYPFFDGQLRYNVSLAKEMLRL